MSLDVEVFVDDPDVHTRLELMCRKIVTALGGLLQGRSAALPAIRVVVTPDFESTVDREIASMDGDLADIALSHEGFGSADGRTLRNHDWSEATVVARAPSGAVDSSAEMGIAKVLGHELSHVAYGAAERDAIGVRGDYPFDFQPAAIVAVHAAEEYRVERLGVTVVDAHEWFRSDDGPFPLADLDRASFRSALPDQFELCARALDELATECRDQGQIGDEWWLQSFAELLAVANAVAYTEADSDGYPSVISDLATPASDLLQPLIDPLVEYLGTSSLLPNRDEWVADISRLEAIGTDGCLAILRRLGIEIDLATRKATISDATWSIVEDAASD